MTGDLTLFPAWDEVSDGFVRVIDQRRESRATRGARHRRQHTGATSAARREQYEPARTAPPELATAACGRPR